MIYRLLSCSTLEQNKTSPIPELVSGLTIYNTSIITFQSSFIGAIAIGDLVKSTMGPKGMDKILVTMGQDGYPGEIQVREVVCVTSNNQSELVI